jgi:hypothetical protein
MEARDDPAHGTAVGKEPRMIFKTRSQGLGDDGIVVHYRPSTCASTASV